jgi:hypothetical protein
MIQKTCECGRYVRQVNEKESYGYTPGKRTTREGFNHSMYAFKTHPAYDGLCSRCRDLGYTPDYAHMSPTGEQNKYANKRRTHNERSYDALEVL